MGSWFQLHHNLIEEIRSVFLVGVLILASACCSTTGPGESQDARNTDSGGEWVDPGDGWIDHEGFRSTSEKPLVTWAGEAAQPSIAFNGSEVGLVYRLKGDGITAAIRFLPVDSKGGAVGAEAVVLEDEGLGGAMPRISSSGDGKFLSCALLDSPQRLFVGLVRQDGSIEASAQTEFDGELYDPLSAPVRIGGRVFVLAGIIGGYPGEVALFRFSYPDLRLDRSSRMISFDGMGIAPVIMSSSNGTTLVVNSSHTSLGYAAIEDVDINEMYFTGAITTFGGDNFTNPVIALHASSSVRTWFGYTVLRKSDGASWQLKRFDPIADHVDGNAFWDGPVQPGGIIHHIMDSDTSDQPTSGAAFAVYNGGVWQVWMHVIDGAGMNAPTGLFPVGEVAAPADTEYPPSPAVAWTGEGFLVVWDRLGQSLAGSYVDSTR